MKAKLSKVVIIAIVIALSVMALSGCVHDSKKINIDIEDGTTPYEIAADAALDSIAQVTVYKLIDSGSATTPRRYGVANSTVGLVIDNNHILVNKRILPNPLKFFPGIPDNFIVKVEVNLKGGGTEILDVDPLPVEIFDNQDDDLGLVLLKIKEENPPTVENRELIPCVFGDSDSLTVGMNTLAVSVRTGFIRTYEVLVANTTVVHGHYQESASDMFGGNVTPSSIYTSGSHTNDSVDDYVGDLVDPKIDYIEPSSAVLFDMQGRVVGFNYALYVDTQDNNISVVGGVGYAIRGNAIVEGLRTGGFIV